MGKGIFISKDSVKRFLKINFPGITFINDELDPNMRNMPINLLRLDRLESNLSKNLVGQ